MKIDKWLMVLAVAALVAAAELWRKPCESCFRLVEPAVHTPAQAAE